jgi:hypothetical protein
MPPKPWTTLIRPDPDREYLVLLSEAVLRRFRELGVFLSTLGESGASWSALRAFSATRSWPVC